MDVNHQTETVVEPRLVRDWDVLALQICTAFFVVSSVTLPFINAIWVSEIPLVALIQVPKVESAKRILVDVVMPMMSVLGLSSGSFSPDYIVARPYALVIVYLIPLAIILGGVALRTRMAGPRRRRWACILLIAAALDYCLTLVFARVPGLAIY